MLNWAGMYFIFSELVCPQLDQHFFHEIPQRRVYANELSCFKLGPPRPRNSKTVSGVMAPFGNAPPPSFSVWT